MEKLTTLPTETQGTTEDALSLPNKYHYPEFAGWNGERYLKKLLRQILPMALYRTWEIFADHQAIGNECYLSVPHLAEIAGRNTRTIEKNLASLCAKHLLIERAERKVFRSSTSVVKSRVVIIKDFTGLYALAHEYHEWLNAEEYLAPDREMLALLQEAPNLVAKLRRFENYRKVLYNRLPGPFSQLREKDRWFSEYQAEPSFTTTAHKRVRVAKQPQTVAIPAKDPATHLAHDLANSSAKRITKTNPMNKPEGDSFDSALAPSSGNSLKDGESTEPSAGPQKTPSLALDERRRKRQEQQNHRVLTPVLPSQKEFPDSQNMPESAEASRVVMPASRGEARAGVGQAQCSWAGSDDQAAPLHLLASSFVREIVAPFGDLNPKGTQTQILSILNEAHLDQPADVLARLVHAYVVARDTRTIRPEHCHPETGLANRMPLFCAMFRRFVEARVQGRAGDYSWRQMEEEIATDERLARWWKEHQRLMNNPFLPVFNEPGGEQRRPGIVVPGNMPETERGMRSAPVRYAHHTRGTQNGSASAWVSGGTARPPISVGSATNRPDQYEVHIKALMARYSAPEAWQGVQ